MTEDKDIKENYKLLDDILDYLILQDNYTSEILDIINHIYHTHLKPKGKENYDSIEDFFNNVDFSFVENTKKLKIQFALFYLVNQNIITFHSSYVTISYLGIIEASKGFVTTYKYEKSVQSRLESFDKFQRSFSNQMFWLTLWIMVGTLVAAMYYILEMISTPYCFCK
jgi:hypothetical protein